jgi:hypothetical protein
LSFQDVGGRKGRGVIDAVADHGHALTLSLQLLDLHRLVFRQHFREDCVDAKLCGDSVGHGLRVSRQHRHLDAAFVQGMDGLADSVGNGEYRKGLAIAQKVNSGLAPSGRIVGFLLEFIWDLDALRPQQRGPAHLVLGAVNRRCDTLSRDRLEAVGGRDLDPPLLGPHVGSNFTFLHVGPKAKLSRYRP